ncbi:hypothetical protein GCM10009119_12810 [Algoriphagus jejuensis]|uniref:YdhG-like domain-containing protein n=1 Tax=Algoriphagus jejuensis TaxID=419934 RepID=A0ABN1MXX9_9BACT
MAEAKTKPTEMSVDDFINTVESPKKREDAFALKKMMEEITGEPAVMWGPSIIGFGTYHYKYATGHEGDAPIVGFSPRKAAISLYLLSCEQQKFEPLLEQLGKHKRAVACIYAKRLSDLNEDILRELIAKSYEVTKAQYTSK